MIKVLLSTSALFFGLLLLMIGHGLQSSLMGIRGEFEGFGTFELSVVMSCYFAGFLFGSRLTPRMIRRVGHVRVFAALGSFISAALILFPMITDPIVWAVLRFVLGFCFCGVYVVTESWLNNAATNEFRGKLLAAYMLVQMAGLMSAQWILSLGDPSGFILFIVPSVLVSISFAPILLSVTPTPHFETTKPMTLKRLFEVSPLGCVGMFFIGGIFAAHSSMASLYASRIGFDLGQISSFIAAIYFGAVLFQMPVGWISDRVDRRVVIVVASLLGTCVCVFGLVMPTSYQTSVALAFLAGGLSNPLYSLFIAHTSDFLDPDEMAASSGGLLFVSGLGSTGGPVVAGYMFETVGPSGFWWMQIGSLGCICLYALWRMTRRRAVSVEDTSSYVAITPTTTLVAAELAQAVAIDMAEEQEGAAESSP